MGANTKIEWAHHTFNPWIGCSKVSLGCHNCYAEEMMAKRYGRAQWGPGGTRVRTSEANWKKPLQWDKAAAVAGERHRVFCASLADVFENRVELWPWRDDLFRLILDTPNLDWLLLTKRPENAHSMILDALAADDHNVAWADNVWIGTSIENQKQADKRIPELLEIPAKVRFLSIEPLLGPVDLTLAGRPMFVPKLNRYIPRSALKTYVRPPTKGGPPAKLIQNQIDWVIVGGESGHNARPMHPDWARSLRDQCQAAGVPFFFKQYGEWTPRLRTRDKPHVRYGEFHRDGEWIESCMCCDGQPGATMFRVGKHAAGRLLDRRTWNEVP